MKIPMPTRFSTLLSLDFIASEFLKRSGTVPRWLNM